MTAENLSMFHPEELPQTDEPKNESKSTKNCLQEILLELMRERNVTPADIHKATGIHWATLMDWHNGRYKSQQTDDNLFYLAQYFNVSIDYLCYGIGDDSPRTLKFEQRETK